MRVALFGAGRIGQVHAPNIAAHPDSQLAAVVDPVPAAAEALASRMGVPVMTEAEALADPSIDAVVVASSTDRHADQVEAAASAGKAVFCEKPLDLALDRVRAVAEHLSRHPVPLMLGFNRRFDPNFRALKARIEDGTVGQVELVTLISRDPGPPPIDYIRRSGGLFRDMMIHDLDLARWLVGAEFEVVAATGSALVDPEIGAAGDVDTAAVTLRSEAGVIVSITNSRRATYGYDQRIEVHGSGGLVAAENVRESTVVTATAEGVRLEKPMHFFLERYAAAYRAEWEAFVGLVTRGEGADSLPGVEAGLRSLELADRASALAGVTVG